MAGMLVLTTMQPIVGVDMHQSIPPIPPALLPHVVVWGTGLSLAMGLPESFLATHAMSPIHPDPDYSKQPIAVGPGHACGRGHDAGALVAHIAANALLPVILLGAASKSEFGSGTVLVGGKGEKMAVNLLLFMNLQLHCDDPVPMPSGFTFATGSEMVYANLTFMDVLNGFAHMLVDVILVAVLNFAIAGAGKAMGHVVAATGMKGLLSEMAGNAKSVLNDLEDIFIRKLSNGKRVIDWSRLTPKGFAQQATQAFRSVAAKDYRKEFINPGFLGAAGRGISAWRVGSPLGASAKFPSHSDGTRGDSIGGPGAQAADAADTGVDKLFSE
jgi:hypothetical protein